MIKGETMNCIIDRTKCTLPLGYSLFHARFSYGKEVNCFVSAQNRKQAREIVNDTYSYLGPKIIYIDFVSSDNKIIYDRTKQLILGELNIVEERRTI